MQCSIAYRDFALETNLSREIGQVRLHGTLVDLGVLEGSLSIGVRESDPSLSRQGQPRVS